MSLLLPSVSITFGSYVGFLLVQMLFRLNIVKVYHGLQTGIWVNKKHLKLIRNGPKKQQKKKTKQKVTSLVQMIFVNVRTVQSIQASAMIAKDETI